jgi:hypothetical protein
MSRIDIFYGLKCKLLWRITSNLPLRVINDGECPYLERYFVLHLLGWRVYVHRFVASDPDRGLHDHPWEIAVSLLVAGRYVEQRRWGTRLRKSWSVATLDGDTFHRVLIPYVESTSHGTWSVFAHRAAVVKPWGFLQPIASLAREDSVVPESAEDAAVFMPFANRSRDVRWERSVPRARDHDQRVPFVIPAPTFEQFLSKPE